MDIENFGRPTHHTRVERWECDYNNHWNTRYYGRSFQQAAETLAADESGQGAGAAVIRSRHMRFMGELFVSTPVQVRSARVAGGEYAGAVLHVLSGAGKLSATAIDRPGSGGTTLPRVDAGAVADLLPRGLDMIPADIWEAYHPERRVELGVVRPGETDHTGGLLFEEVIRRVAMSSHDHLAGLGFTVAYSEATGINRMTVELRVTLHEPAPAGQALYARARLAMVGKKNFATAYRIETRSGTLIATAGQNLLAVDLKARKAVAVPDFLRL